MLLNHQNAYQALLLDYQINWLLDESPVIVWEKSRRIGASYVDALKSVLLASRAAHRHGMSSYYVSYNKEMTRQYINDSALWAKRIGAAASEVEEIIIDPKKDIITYQLSFATGFTVQALSSNPDNFRSKQGRAVIDEASFVDNLPELLKAALAFVMLGGQVAVLSTHNGVNSDFNELVQEIKAGRKSYSLHRTTFDEALKAGYYRKIVCSKKALSWTAEGEAAFRTEIIDIYKDNAEEELFCVPKKSGGAYFPLNLLEINFNSKAQVLRFKAPESTQGQKKYFVDWTDKEAEKYVKEWILENVQELLLGLNFDNRHYFGWDFGRSGDLSVMWVLAEKADLRLETAFVLELRDTPFRSQEQFLKEIGLKLPRFSGGALDARGNGQQLAERARQIFGKDFIFEIFPTSVFYAESFPLLKTRLEDKTVDIPKDSFIRDDLRMVKLIGGVPKLPEAKNKDDSGKRHGDGAIALNLAVYAEAKALKSEPWEIYLPGESESRKILKGF